MTGPPAQARRSAPRPQSAGGRKPAHPVPLASARQHPENQKENQAGHSPERAVEGQGRGGGGLPWVYRPRAEGPRRKGKRPSFCALAETPRLGRGPLHLRTRRHAYDRAHDLVRRCARVRWCALLMCATPPSGARPEVAPAEMSLSGSAKKTPSVFIAFVRASDQLSQNIETRANSARWFMGLECAMAVLFLVRTAAVCKLSFFC